MMICLCCPCWLVISARSRPWDKVGGERSSRPLDKGGPGLQKTFFRPFGPQFGLKIRGWTRHWLLTDPIPTTIQGTLAFVVRVSPKYRFHYTLTFVFICRSGYSCGTFTRHVTNEGKGELRETRIWKTRRAQKVCAQSCGCSVVHSRQW